MSRPSSLRTFGTAGTVAIEYAMVLPVMLMFTIGTMDAARLLWTFITLSEATDSAARCGALVSAACPNVATYAAGRAFGLPGVSAASNFTANPPIPASASSWPTCGGQPGEQVVGTYTFKFVAPWFGSMTLPLTATACYPEQH